ncbi:MAG: hypothetical protein NTY34_06065 [Candidatus Omnitrophica bacterium]|nr:hypothetical protein [Candidatus Omnitrophota bacterium]
MNYREFMEKWRDAPYINMLGVFNHAGANQSMRNQLTRWQKKGLIIQLKRGTYILNKNDRNIFPSRFFFANQIMWPSYVSLESALGYYGLIPEMVSDVTSVTSKKTARFKNGLGQFIYQHLKLDIFKGYSSFKDESGMDVLIAVPEKALIDFLYLNLSKFKVSAKDVFRDSCRFQNTEQLNCRKIVSWARSFKNRRLESIAGEFCAFIRDEEK